jgi:hypothetical protein
MRNLAGIAGLVGAGLVVVLSAGCGDGNLASTSEEAVSTQASSPRVEKFDGPSVVLCEGHGATIHVPFTYETTNATRVSFELDGAPIASAAVYPPGSGTVRFDYKCPGPHMVAISAVGEGNRSASATVTFNESNHAVSSSSSVDVGGS